MRLLPKFTADKPVNIVFVPSNRFFFRVVPLAPGAPVLEQAALGLEGFSPFPLPQLYWGCCVAPVRDRILVYAAYRRRFTAEETARWDAADLVVPEVLMLLGTTPERPGLRVLAGEACLSGAVWDDRSGWPVAVLAREYTEPVTDEARRCFADELRARAGLADSPVLFVEGIAAGRREADDLIVELQAPDGGVVSVTRIPGADEDLTDVRDRVFTARRRAGLRRGEYIWRWLVLNGAAAALAAMLDAGALAFHWLDHAQRARVARQQPVVEKLEAAHALAGKVDELTHQQLRFFDMLDLVNGPRPRSIQFTRTGAGNRHSIEIEARTDNAQEVPVYEAALRALPALERVEVRGLRTRDGHTIFGLQIVFKAGSPAAGGAP